MGHPSESLKQKSPVACGSPAPGQPLSSPAARLNQKIATNAARLHLISPRLRSTLPVPALNCNRTLSYGRDDARLSDPMPHHGQVTRGRSFLTAFDQPHSHAASARARRAQATAPDPSHGARRHGSATPRAHQSPQAGVGRASRWSTLRALRVLDWYGRWASDTLHWRSGARAPDDGDRSPRPTAASRRGKGSVQPGQDRRAGYSAAGAGSVWRPRSKARRRQAT
jgi:hypothetical protein